MLAHALNIDSQGLVLPDFVAFGGPLVDGDEQVLDLLVVDFHHGDVDLVLFVSFVGVLGDSVENFLAGDGDDSLGYCGPTLLAPYPTIE